MMDSVKMGKSNVTMNVENGTIDSTNGTVEFLNDTMELYRTTLMSWLEDPGADEWDGLDLTKLKIDEAYVVPSTTLGNISLYSVSDDCYRCPFELQRTFGSNSTEPWVVSTTIQETWRLMTSATDQFITMKNRSGMVCELRPEVGEFGVYNLNVTSAGCHFTTSKEPVNIYLPLLLMALVLGGLGLIYAAFSILVSYIQKKVKMRYGDKELDTQQRSRAIDTFRGVVIVFMIFVNNGGGGYKFTKHVTWNGLHLADLVFPCFVWIMGVCIPLSVKGVFSRGVPRWKAALWILRRSCLMFLLGVMLNTIFNGSNVHNIRVMGVLQRLGISYLVVATFYLFTAKKYFTHPRGACGQALKDVWSVVWCWLLAAVLIVLHTVITLRVHDPDCPSGYLGPGGKHNNFAAQNCTGGASGYIDYLLLGKTHIYQHFSTVYANPKFDPENLLGCLTTIVHVVLGVQAGATQLHYKSHQSKTARWFAWAVIFALVGAILCGFSKEKGIIPINKNLWSISFVLVMSAFSCALLSIIYLLTDAWGLWSGAPFHAPGLNAIFLYLGHQVCSYVFPFRWSVPPMRTHAIKLAENLWGVALWIIVAYIMARKKIFITL